MKSLNYKNRFISLFFCAAIGYVQAADTQNNEKEKNTSTQESPSPESILNTAFYYYNNFDYDKAVQYFEKYNQMVGDEEVSLMHLGKIYLNLKQNDKARGYFERILKVNATNTDALSFLADIFINEKNLDQAIRVLKAIVELEPVDERALFTLAEIYREKKNQRMSMVYYKKLSIATIKNSSNLRLLSKAYTQIARYYYDNQDYEKALEYYGKIVEVSPEDFNSLYIYGELLKVNGKFTESAEVMKKMLQKDPSNQSILESLVESLFITSDYQTRAYLKTYMENTDHPDAIYSGIEKVINNERVNARTLFQKVLKKNPNRISAHIGLLNTIDQNDKEEIKKEAYTVAILAQKIRSYSIAQRYMDTVLQLLDDEKKSKNLSFNFRKTGANEANDPDVEKLINEFIDSYYTHAISLENLGNPKQAVAYYLESIELINDLISRYQKDFKPKDYIHEESNMLNNSDITLPTKKDSESLPVKLKTLYQKKFEVLLNVNWAIFRHKDLFHYDIQNFLKENIELSKEDPRAYFMNGIVTFEGAKDSKNDKYIYQNAENFFIKAVNLAEIASEQKNAPANYYFYLGLAYDKLNEFDKMADYLKKAIELEPNNPTYLNYLGYMYSIKNINLGNALDYVGRALEDDPENDAYLDTLGWIYFKMSKYEEGLGQLLVAKTLSEKKGKQDPVIDYHIAETYKKLNNSSQALRFYKTTLENIGNASEPMDKVYIQSQIQKLSNTTPDSE